MARKKRRVKRAGDPAAVAKLAERVEEVRVLPVRVEDYLPREVQPYVPISDELEVIRTHLQTSAPLLVAGPRGQGKTLALAYTAYLEKCPIVQFDCSEGTKRSHLIGQFLLIGNEVYYQLGALPTAVELANRYGAAIIVFEEINALPSQMQKLLNQLLDWRQHVHVPELQRIYRVRSGARLLCAATMNPGPRLGAFELNEDLMSRFAILYIDYPPPDKEKEIIETVLGRKVDAELLRRVLLLAHETRKGVETAELDYAISTRDVIQFFNLLGQYRDVLGVDRALKWALRTVLLNKFEDPGQRETVRERILSIFGVEL